MKIGVTGSLNNTLSGFYLLLHTPHSTFDWISSLKQMSQLLGKISLLENSSSLEIIPQVMRQYLRQLFYFFGRSVFSTLKIIYLKLLFF